MPPVAAPPFPHATSTSSPRAGPARCAVCSAEASGCSQRGATQAVTGGPHASRREQIPLAAEPRTLEALGGVAGAERRIVAWRLDDGLVGTDKGAVLVVVELADRVGDTPAPQGGDTRKADHAALEGHSARAAGAGIGLPVEGHDLSVARSAAFDDSGGAKRERERRREIGEALAGE